MTARASGLLRDGAIAGVSTLLMSAATYAFYVAATRSLGVDGGGTVLAVISALLLCSLPFGVAGLAVSSEIARVRVEDRPAQLRGLLVQAARFAAASAVIIAVGTLLAQRALLTFFHLGDVRLVWFAAAGFAANAVLLFARCVLQGFGAYRAFGTSNVVEAAAKFGAAAVVIRMPAVDVAVGAFSAALAAACVVTLTATARRLPGGAGEPGALSAALRRSASVVAVMGTVTFMTFFDSVAARHYLTARDAGLYNAASLCGRALMTLLAFVPSVILPKVAERFAAGEATADVGRVAAGMTAAVCLAAIAVFAAVPAFIITTVGGPAYRAGAPLVPLYGWAAAALSLASVVATYRLGRGERGLGRRFAVVGVLEFTAIVLLHGTASTIVGCIAAGHSLALLGAVLPSGQRTPAAALASAIRR